MKLKLEEFQRTDNISTLELFNQGLRADATKRAYNERLRYILCNVFEDILTGNLEERATQLVEKSRSEPEWITDLLLSLSKKLRLRTALSKNDENYLAPSTIKNYYKPIKKLLEMNNIILSWKRIYATFPEFEYGITRGWTRDEVERIVLFTKPMTKAMVLILASSGIRAGGLVLQWRDIVPVYRVDGKLTLESSSDAILVCAILYVYRGSAWEYPAFITPEAFHYLMLYRDSWIGKVGRYPTGNDPVFIQYKSELKTVETRSVYTMIHDAVKKANLRPLEKRRQHEVPLLNGFRRFWNKTCKETASNDSALSSLIKKEFMMGHVGLLKLDRNYFKTNLMELASEYVDLVPHLTITEGFRNQTKTN